MNNHVSLGYKQTEVGVIPDDWEVKTLSAVSSMKSGEGITASRIDEHSQYPCYGGNGLRGFTSRYTHDGSFALIGRQGALCGNVVGVTGKLFASEHAVVVTSRQGTNIQFLTYVLGEMHLNRLSEASAQPGLSVSKILQLSIATPRTEAEQRAIATTLSDVDGLLGGLDRLIAKKRDLKQTAMQQLLTGQTRLPGFHGEWDVKRLEDGVALHSGHHVLSQHCNTQFDGIPYLTGPADFPEGRICHTKFTTRPSTICSPGDILVTVKGSGSGTIVLADAGYCISRQLMAIRVNDWDVRFIYYSLLQNAEQFRAASTGLIPGLSRSDILDQPLPIPPTNDEQTAIAAVLTDMDAELAALTQRRDKTRALKQAMMQELLTGRTRLIPKSTTEVQP
jgi:type I restriction enzyme, S subunit